jgi:Raf kinase inhibitor-like YbhB/YbcL family protein
MKHHIIPVEAEKAVNYKLLKVTSEAFDHQGMIPAKYTCDGANISPPLDIDHIPEEAKSLVLIVDDPDAPSGVWTHWIVWNIPVTHHIKENQVHGQEGLNDFRQSHYGGPCPPSGTHHYFFKVYALDKILDLPSQTKKSELEKEISGNIIGFGELIGRYKKG